MVTRRKVSVYRTPYFNFNLDYYLNFPLILYFNGFIMTNLTENIFRLSAPYNNPYQGGDKRLLFVCSAGLLRSATGANLYAKEGYNTRNCGTHDYALIPLSNNLIFWADRIFFVNKENYQQALKTFGNLPSTIGEMQSKSQVLDIPDDYPYNHPTLIKLLKEQVKVD